MVERIGEVLAELNEVLSHEARGRLIREGATVVIAGRVNAGKSSLFNALIGQERAIVTDVPGTTRDLLTETIDLDGLAITLVDTAGERETQDAVEREGVSRAVRARDAADLMLIVIDSGEELTEEDRRLLEQSSSAARLVVASKSDREPKWEMEGALRVSTVKNAGLDELRRAMVCSLTGAEGLKDPAAISNLRHVLLLKEARATLTARLRCDARAGRAGGVRARRSPPRAGESRRSRRRGLERGNVGLHLQSLLHRQVVHDDFRRDCRWRRARRC